MPLHSLKESGHKVGCLKFKGVVNSIPLKQYNKTYFIKKNKVRIQVLKSWLRVRGLQQIPVDAEIANAVLVRKNNDYYLNITTYTNHKIQVPETSIGIDFGCETQLTFSNGVKIQFQVPVSKRLKRLDRKIMKKRRPNSRNKDKDKAKRQTDYREFKPGETSTSTFLERVSNITGVKVSKLELRSQEAAGLALR